MTWQQRKGGGKSFTREYDQRDHAMASQNALSAAVAATGFEFELAKFTGESPPTSVEERVLYYHDLFYGLHMSKVEGEVQEAVAATVRQFPNAEPVTDGITMTNTPAPGPGSHVIGFGKYTNKTIGQVFMEDENYVSNFLAKVMEPRNDTGRAAQEAARAFMANAS